MLFKLAGRRFASSQEQRLKQKTVPQLAALLTRLEADRTPDFRHTAAYASRDLKSKHWVVRDGKEPEYVQSYEKMFVDMSYVSSLNVSRVDGCVYILCIRVWGIWMWVLVILLFFIILVIRILKTD